MKIPKASWSQQLVHSCTPGMVLDWQLYYETPLVWVLSQSRWIESTAPAKFQSIFPPKSRTWQSPSINLGLGRLFRKPTVNLLTSPGTLSTTCKYSLTKIDKGAFHFAKSVVPSVRVRVCIRKQSDRKLRSQGAKRRIKFVLPNAKQFIVPSHKH